MPNNKQKGSKTEIRLCKLFNSLGFRAVRVAGSGLMENSDCDIIAGNKNGKYCIEVKATKKKIKYISKEQMKRFLLFSEIIDLTPVIAVKFNYKDWTFLSPSSMNETSESYSIKLSEIESKGKTFKDFFKLTQLKGGLK